MEKIIKKWGNSHIIVLDPEDMKINELEEGNIVEVRLIKYPKEVKK